MQDNTFKYYIDGNLVLTSSTTGTTTYSTPVLGAIGKRTSASQYFHGEIDDVMITKESLTDGEVLALFQSTSGCPNNVVGSPLITVKQVVGSIFMGIPFNVEALTSSFIANSSNTYQVQLSDVNGTFNTFTTIGTSNNTIISCTIPANMTFSNNYKIRIIATDPALTSINTQNLTITDKRLVSCYSFTGSTNDGKGSNHGIATGGSYTTNRFGIASSAYLLNGTSEFISIPTTDLNNLSYSFSAWIKPYSMPTVSGNPTRTMVSLGNLGGDQSMLFAYNATPATSVLQVAASGVTATTPNYNVNIPTNTAWKHVVGVLQGNTLKYYLDGNLVHTTTTSGNPVYNSPILGQIGRRISGSQYFHGEIDDVMLFKDGLNDAEVLALYTSNSGCPTTVENSRLIVLKPLTNNAICVNTSFNVTFLTSNFTANAGNTYIVQLSDNTGGFGSPTNIGTGTGTTLSCTILNTVAVGSNYKIRIIASNPSLIS